MTLSQTAEHALRAILFLAGQPRGSRIPADAIADALDAPRNYLSKTLGALVKAGVITSARGPSGGFRLAVAPEELTLARVVGPFEEETRRKACLLGDRTCDSHQPCAAHERWVALRSRARAPMEETTVADLLEGGNEEPRREFAA